MDAGYSCATVGLANEWTVRDCIENQNWCEDLKGVKFTAPEST